MVKVLVLHVVLLLRDVVNGVAVQGLKGGSAVAAERLRTFRLQEQHLAAHTVQKRNTHTHKRENTHRKNTYISLPDEAMPFPSEGNIEST